ALARAIVADGGGGDDAVAFRKNRQARLMHLSCRLDLMQFAALGGWQRHGAAYQDDVVTGFERGLGQRVAHLSAAGVRQKAHVVEVLARRSGRNEDAHAQAVGTSFCHVRQIPTTSLQKPGLMSCATESTVSFRHSSGGSPVIELRAAATMAGERLI